MTQETKPELSTWPGKMTVDSRGFVLVSWPNGHCITEEHARQALEVLKGINAEAGGKLRPLVADISNIRELTLGARRVFMSQEAGTTCTAVALVGSNPVATMIGNVFLLWQKKPTPMKLFTSMPPAIDWLMSLR